MFKNKYSNFLTVLLVIAIIAIIVIATIFASKIYKNYKSEKEAKQAITEFLTNTNVSIDNNINEGQSNVTDSNASVEDNTLINNQIITGENIVVDQNNNQNNTSTSKKVKFYDDFVMIGYIEIPKTGIEYPILTETTAEALDASVGVLYPTNPILNTTGNVVIIGHNYRNGKFFSNNKKLSVGDKINITDEEGKKLTYTIYEIFETTPEDTAYITRNTEDNIEISLSTCTDDGKKRLVILAKV